MSATPRLATLAGAGAAALLAVTCGGSQVAAPTAPSVTGVPVVTARQTTSGAVDLASFEIRPREFNGGEWTRATATLSGPAPEGGVEVTLTATKREARIPDAFTIAAGQVTGSVAFSTGDVSADMEVLITATAGGASRTVQIRLWPKRRGGPAPGTPAAATGTITLGGAIN